MKILDILSYNEKLKINPINLNDFDKIGLSSKTIYTKYKKQDLKTGDICQINNGSLLKLGVVIMKETDVDLSIYGFNKHTDDIPLILIYSPEREYLTWSYVKLADYDELLRVTRNYISEIVKIMPNTINANIINDPDELKKQLINYKKLFK